MTLLEESFAGPRLDERLQWLNEPEQWRLAGGGLALRTGAGTDFWQGTHYGFRVDNGHFLHVPVDGDCIVETAVEVAPVHQYDQAGLMVRLSERDWIKTSVEFEPGLPSRLGAVITNHGWSDWSTQDIDPAAGTRVEFRVTRVGADYLIEAAVGDAWQQIRLGRLQSDTGDAVAVGLYACSPKAAGLEATFKRLAVTRP